MLFLCVLLVPMNGLMHHSGPLSCLPLKARPRQNGPRANLSLSMSECTLVAETAPCEDEGVP